MFNNYNNQITYQQEIDNWSSKQFIQHNLKNNLLCYFNRDKYKYTDKQITDLKQLIIRDCKILNYETIIYFIINNKTALPYYSFSYRTKDEYEFAIYVDNVNNKYIDKLELHLIEYFNKNSLNYKDIQIKQEIINLCDKLKYTIIKNIINNSNINNVADIFNKSYIYCNILNRLDKEQYELIKRITNNSN